jgi:DNA-binding SARP family transcriptional activator
VNGAEVLPPLRLMLLGGFTLLKGTEEIDLPLSAQRLVVLLALREHPLSRAYIAGILWPDYSTDRSMADLRTALWRANRYRPSVVTTAGMRLLLARGVQVDVRALARLGRVTPGHPAKGVIDQLAGMSWVELSMDLLPDWYDDWLIEDREGVRQLRLHALELLTDELSRSGRHGEAIQAALAAVRLEPLRETAHAALIRAHLAEGNRSEAVRQYYRCRDALAAELAVEPSEAIRQLISRSALLRSGSLRSQHSSSSRSPSKAAAPSQAGQRPAPVLLQGIPELGNLHTAPGRSARLSAPPISDRPWQQNARQR